MSKSPRPPKQPADAPTPAPTPPALPIPTAPTSPALPSVLPKNLTLTVETVPLVRLLPHPKNPRHHPEPDTAEWNTLLKSLEHDYFDPLIWNRRNGFLVSGHLRTKILATQGVETVQVIVVDYDESIHVARMIAANKSAGTFNDEQLQALLIDVSANVQLSALSGFTDEQLVHVIGHTRVIGGKSTELEAPAEFPISDESIKTDYRCPKCQYAWSGKPE